MKRILKSLIILILCSLLIIDIVLLSQGITLAIYDELEMQTVNTNVKNVEFNAYFLKDEEKVHQDEKDIREEENLTLNINVKEKGVLEEGKIKIENSNFKIIKDRVESEAIKDINEDTNEIELNKIVYQNNIIINLPIKFNKVEKFDDSYFEKENKITITGKYKDEKEQDVYGEIHTKLKWNSKIDIELKSNIDKYLDLGEKGILLQQNITTEIQENEVPRKNEKLSVQVPVLDNNLPGKIEVLLNGKKLSEDNIDYNLETKILEVNNENEGDWDSGINEYKIIYKYDKVVGFNPRTIELIANSESELYTQEKIVKDINQTIQVSSIGNVVSLKKSGTEEIYKGYMYAGGANETSIEESNEIEISDKDSIQEIELQKEVEYFSVDGNTKNKEVTDILYKSTQIDKNDFIRILGEEGKISIKDASDQLVGVIDKNSNEENGKYIVYYDNEVNYLKFEVSQPIEIGKFDIKNNRIIRGNLGCSKESLKTFKTLVTNNIVKTNLSEEIAEAKTNLIDSKTEATLEINKTDLLTLKSNENVQMLVTLKSDSAQYDLYKNPNIEIIIPKELKINIKNITQLNKIDELRIIKNNIYVTENQETVINLSLQGEQLTFENTVNKGIQIAIIADIQIDKSTPSKEIQMTMNYTNDNGNEKSYTKTTPIKLKSKYGVLTVNKLSNYNLKEESVENIDNSISTAKLDINSNKKIANKTISIVNNYETDITNVSIIGIIPNIREEKVNEVNLKSDFEAYLKNKISFIGEVGKIYYSEDINISDNTYWKENLEDISKAKAFKIELLNNKIKAGDSISLTYDFEIPSNLDENRESYDKLVLDYDYAGQTYTTTSTILLQTEKNLNEKNENIETYSESKNGLKYSVYASTVEGNIKETQDVKEGENINYTIEVTNNSNKNIKNLKLEATYENGIIWDHIEYKQGNTYTGEEDTVTKYDENPDLKKLEMAKDELKIGETVEFKYQVSVKEVDNDEQMFSGNIRLFDEQLENDEKIKIEPSHIKQGNLKLKLLEDIYEQTNIYSGRDLPVKIQVKNISNETMKDVIVEVSLKKGLNFLLDGFDETENVEFVDYSNKIIKFKIKEIKAGEEESFINYLETEEIELDKTECLANVYFNIEIENEKYYSNEINRTIYQSKTKVIANQVSSNQEEYIKTGDNITFTTEIKNLGAIPIILNLYDDVPRGMVVQKAYILKNESKEDIELIEDSNYIDISTKIEANQIIKLVIETQVNTDYIFEESIKNYVTIRGMGIDITTNAFTYKVKGINDNSQDTEDSKDTEDIFSISGLAWIDKNKNGYFDDTEEKFKNIEVLLINAKTGDIVTDKEGKEIKTITNEEGLYNFEDLEVGEYIVVFKYDSNKYEVTEYKAKIASDSSNSDVISKNIKLNGEEQIVAMTSTLNLKDGDIENINAGFVEKEKFDLRLDKYINSIIIQDKKGTTKKQYDNAKLAKIELDSKNISGTTVVIEYVIQVKNEGEVAGYVNEVVDYMPKDLSFNSAMNKDWYQLTDGNVYSKKLMNDVINPGETKTLTLTLTKFMNQKNMGTIINTAEINNASNNLAINDIDSVPGNKVNEEDDISTAQTIISIKTGGIIIYTILGIIMLILIGLILYLIIKKQNKERR